MPAKFPPMRLIDVERPDPSTVVVVVEHDAAQSYSRAVRPFAYRHAGAAVGARAADWIGTGVADRGTVIPGAEVRRGTRCLVGYVFRERAAYEREEAAADQLAAVLIEDQADAMPEATSEELAHLFGH